ALDEKDRRAGVVGRLQSARREGSRAGAELRPGDRRRADVRGDEDAAAHGDGVCVAADIEDGLELLEAAQIAGRIVADLRGCSGEPGPADGEPRCTAADETADGGESSGGVAAAVEPVAAA